MIAQASATSRAVSTRLFGELNLELSELVHFPDGLPGFPACRTFALLPTDVGALAWLQSADQPDLALLLVTSDAAVPGAVTVPEPLRRKGLFTAMVVTLPGPDSGYATANLQAPIVIDRKTGLGRQVILPDSRFSVAHPFDLNALASRAA